MNSISVRLTLRYSLTILFLSFEFFQLEVKPVDISRSPFRCKWFSGSLWSRFQKNGIHVIIEMAWSRYRLARQSNQKLSFEWNVVTYWPLIEMIVRPFILCVRFELAVTDLALMSWMALMPSESDDASQAFDIKYVHLLARRSHSVQSLKRLYFGKL